MKIIALAELPTAINPTNYVVEDLVFERISKIKMQDYSKVLAIFTKVSIKLDNNLIKKFPNLIAIGIPATGIDMVDKEFCDEQNIKIISLREHEFKSTLESFSSTSEIFFWHLLSLVRNCQKASEAVSFGNWNRNKFIGHNLRNLNLGIVGFGRLGKQISCLGNSLGMNVRFYDIDKTKKPNDSITRCNSLEELFSKSNVISINVSVDKSNQKFINSDLIREVKLKPFYIINTSRGSVIDETAIINGLSKGKIDGYGADVLEGEGSFDSEWLIRNPLWQALTTKHYNITLTPHIGGATFQNILFSEDFIFRKLVSTLYI